MTPTLKSEEPLIHDAHSDTPFAMRDIDCVAPLVGRDYTSGPTCQLMGEGARTQ